MNIIHYDMIFEILKFLPIGELLNMATDIKFLKFRTDKKYF